MKYFTPERHLALQDFSSDEVMDAADAAWQIQVDAYEAYLATIRSTLPDDVRELVGYYLHDARVLSMARRGDRFEVILQLLPPPQELLTISYTVTGEPAVNEQAFAPAGKHSPLWYYEELAAVPGGFQHSILLSNGWELTVPFRQVHCTFSRAVFPVPTRPQAKSA